MKSSWQVGDQIQGRWEIFRILRGGAGVVYIVYDHAFHEPFAAKTFRDEVFASSTLIADRFMLEAQAWINLDIHPNVTRARMVEGIEGKPFLFLEYVSGGDLGGWIGTPRLTEDLPQVLKFAIQFCDGMTHALNKGIRVHRDVKPRNCLITHDGVLKVTDFGLAKLIDGGKLGDLIVRAVHGQNFNLTATAVGTCTHMAPEQFENARQVDVRADIYSFGVMLYQMVTGQLPFAGQSWQELELQHRTQQPPSLRETDRRLADLIDICLAKDPDSRFSDFAQVRDCLGGLYESIAGATPPAPAEGAALTAVEWNNKGSSLDHLGRRQEAIVCYDQAIQLDPLLASAWFNKGVSLFASGQVSEALTSYEQALHLKPQSEQVWSNKGVALKSLGKLNDAMACYDRAIQFNPRYPNAWVNKGVALKSLGKAKEALVCYERALRLDPSDANAWTNKGNVLYALGRPREAITCYDRALTLNSALDLTWLNRGMALSALGRHEESLACYDKALELNPALAQAWVLAGMTKVNAFRQIREALPYFQEAERLGSKEVKEALAFCQNFVSKT